MKITATFSVHPKGKKTLLDILNQVPSQIHLNCHPLIEEHEDEQVQRAGQDEAGAGVDAENQSAINNDARIGNPDDEDGKLAWSTGEKPVKRSVKRNR